MKINAAHCKLFLFCFSVVSSLMANINISEYLVNIDKLHVLKEEQKNLMIHNWLNYQRVNYGPISLVDGSKEYGNYLKEVLIDMPQPNQNQSGQASPEFLETIREVASFHGLQFVNNVLHVPFKGYTVPLIAEEKYGDDTLSIEGILKDPKEFVGEEEPCLSLLVQDESLVISFLATTYKACPIPQERGGTFLVEFAEEVARLFSRNVIELDDLSQQRCPLNKEWIDFRLLSFLSKGKSWYQAHNYQSVCDEHDDVVQGLLNLSVGQVKEHFYSFDQKKLERLKQYLLLQNSGAPGLQKMIVEFFGSAPFAELQNFLLVYEELENEYRKIKALGERDFSLSKWLSWVWTHNCQAYAKLIKYIFPKASRVEGIGFNYLIPKSISYVKYLP